MFANFWIILNFHLCYFVFSLKSPDSLNGFPEGNGTLKINTATLSALAARNRLAKQNSPLAQTPNLSKGQQTAWLPVQVKTGGIAVGVQREEEEERAWELLK